jgi:hypothetical protein
MRAVIILVSLLLANQGCFTSWAITQASGNQRYLNEKGSELSVPQPGVREHLRVTMSLEPARGEDEPFAFQCRSSQSAFNNVHRTSFRYAGKWKIITATMFLLEAGTAALLYFTKPEEPNSESKQQMNRVVAGIVGVDALGTAALFFAPKKEIFTTEKTPVATAFRTDCPAGLILEIGGDTYPIDAAGRIGDAGEAALDAWMQTPSTPIRMTFHDRVIDLPLNQNEVCTWNRLRHLDQSRCPAYWAKATAVGMTVEVPMGTLTKLE